MEKDQGQTWKRVSRGELDSSVCRKHSIGLLAPIDCRTTRPAAAPRSARPRSVSVDAGQAGAPLGLDGKTLGFARTTPGPCTTHHSGTTRWPKDRVKMTMALQYNRVGSRCHRCAGWVCVCLGGCGCVSLSVSRASHHAKRNQPTNHTHTHTQTNRSAALVLASYSRCSKYMVVEKP